MSINWLLSFPEIIFTNKKCLDVSILNSDKQNFPSVASSSSWDPSKDFKCFLESIKPSSDLLNSEDNYGVKVFEEARLELLERVYFENIGESPVWQNHKVKELISDLITDEDEEIEFDESFFTMWQVSFKNTDDFEREVIKKIGGHFVGKNEISVHRFNLMNIFYKWLLTVNPRGRYGNEFSIMECGITEYDETITCVTLILNDRIQSCTVSPKYPSYGEDWEKFIEKGVRNYVSYSDENDINHLLSHWNKELE